MTTAKLNELLRELRGGLSSIYELADEKECDCPPEWPRCTLCRIRQKASRLERSITKALAEFPDDTTPVVESEEGRAWHHSWLQERKENEELRAEIEKLKTQPAGSWGPREHIAFVNGCALQTWVVGDAIWQWTVSRKGQVGYVGTGSASSLLEAQAAAENAARGAK